MKIRAKITGVAAYVPDYILSNAELEKMVDTTDEWITTRTGIKQRHILKGEGLGTSHMAVEAVKELLQKTRTQAEEIDLIICATTTPDFVFPATANLIAHAIGAKNSFSYDVQAACSGFLYALSAGAQYIETGRYNKVLIIGADKMSSIVDYKDRTTCIIFGDGAGCVLLEPTEQEEGIIDFILQSDGIGQQHLYQKAGGSRRPPTIETVTNREHFVYQEGATVFKYAVTYMADTTYTLMKKHQLKAEDIAWLCTHQANKRIIEATAQRAGLPNEKVMITIDKYGNTTNATIPLNLRDYEKQLKKGDKILFATFGGGFTWGAMYAIWAYDGSKVS
ncbi:MAG: ketoacyl-ACP synthase III [Microscillaceae bacterium]|nr:ketoacyl-ACP synthase III [Microscillaceae bacterium]MDW8460556.1 beta-ketoacyl-ACP synthase III [Cytophagales bacterium]